MMSKFSKILCSILAVVVSCMLASCTKPDDGSGTAEPEIAFKTNPMMVQALAGTYTAEVTANTTWTATPQVDWIRDVKEGDEGILNFVVDANPQTASRDGRIRFSVEGSDYTKDLIIRQAAKRGEFTADPSEAILSVSGAEVSVNVTADYWEIKSVSESWLYAKKKNAATVTLSADVNFTDNARTASVVLTDGDTELTIPVTQERDDAYFKNASTEYTRRFVYDLGKIVTEVHEDRYVVVNDHLSYVYLSYNGPVMGTDKPCAFFLYTLDLTGNLDLVVTCAKDDDASIKLVDTEITDKDIMRQQYADLQRNRPEIKVLGGVNGDFFYGQESKGRGNLLHGVMWRRGVCLKDEFTGGATCTVFARMKDGTARVMSQADYAERKNDIWEAVGARQRIMDKGNILTVADKALEPRTAVAVSQDGKTVYLLVYDGRRTSWSNGANYEMMGEIFKTVGAYDATNLDGGGSSTFALVKENMSGTEVDHYSVFNKPSDGDERKVVNGIAIIQK